MVSGDIRTAQSAESSTPEEEGIQSSKHKLGGLWLTTNKDLLLGNTSELTMSIQNPKQREWQPTALETLPIQGSSGTVEYINKLHYLLDIYELNWT